MMTDDSEVVLNSIPHVSTNVCMSLACTAYRRARPRLRGLQRWGHVDWRTGDTEE